MAVEEETGPAGQASPPPETVRKTGNSSNAYRAAKRAQGPSPGGWAAGGLAWLPFPRHLLARHARETDLQQAEQRPTGVILPLLPLPKPLRTCCSILQSKQAYRSRRQLRDRRLGAGCESKNWTVAGRKGADGGENEVGSCGEASRSSRLGLVVELQNGASLDRMPTDHIY
jgi:hypothetical protein